MPAPTNLILEFQKSGMNNAEIIRRLKEQGYTDKDINDGFNQAKVKQSIRSDEFSQIPEAPIPPAQSMQPIKQTIEQNQYEPVPTPSYAEKEQQPIEEGYDYAYPETQQQYPEEYSTYEQAYTTEAFEEIAESIIEERWRAFMEKIGDIQAWKEKIDREISRVEKRIDKIESSLIGIHSAMLEKVDEYGKGVKELGTDIKAIEKAFSGIMQPLMKHTKKIKQAADKSNKHKTSRKK